MTLTLKFHDSVSHLSDAELDVLTSDTSVFFGRRWLRLLDSVDLSAMARGELSLRYAIVTQQGVPVALCPCFITRSKTIYTPYSLEKFFFTSWKGTFANAGGFSRLAVTVADLYRALAWMSGAGMDGGVFVTSPLSMRSGIACAPQPPESARQCRELILKGLRELAASEQLPLYFYGVDGEDTALREELTAASFQEIYIFDDNVIDVRGEGLDSYLGQFKSDARRLLKREMAHARDAGVRFERVSKMGEMGEQLERFYEVTYSKYGSEHLRHPSWFWGALEQHVSPEAEAVVAYQDGAPIGFSLLLHKHEEVWFYRVGRAEAGASETPLYFNLAFYEPLRRAYELGAKRLWLGPSGYETKRRRGARRHALYSYLWIPQRWSRTVIQPYVSAYSRVTKMMVPGATQNVRVRKGP
ncbi:GNAT family N-acetyltransferase [Pyxidicoccus fallax]|uniref:GNAT family N-acetyltransferase n=1 Tax=Pyxidicoccus fallax TaxID=394095 RepID=A0A848LLW5_9BACT|nr:GNAT family N-acetyltransferase [Pyxidicoccus fallax]NMO18689.1 GNAT family N-acetyltransferase [Pyxidicoccus fallax]NPC79140.1 GNAT family N-acetyltransferase [Pyxidicoccus fallax]